MEQQQLDHSHYPRINAVSLVLAGAAHDTPARTPRARESERQVREAERELTFRPAVNEQSERLAVVLPPDFHFRQRVLQQEEERREEEARQAAHERLQREAPFQPQLAEDVWRRQAMVGRPVDATERLYDVEHERRTVGGWTNREQSAVQSTYADCTFRPRINSNSTVLAYSQLQRGASSSTSASSGSSERHSDRSRRSAQDSELADDASQAWSASFQSDHRGPSRSPAINLRSRLLCLDSGGLEQHQRQSERYQHLLAQHHTQRAHLAQQHADRQCTFAPAVLPPPQPAAPHPVPGVSAYMHHRALVNEQREWRRRREREVFMIDAMERAGRRGGTQVKGFRLETEKRGRQQREWLNEQREARRNRDY